MSTMYGKHRVVLSAHGRVALCGSKSGIGGTYNPVGHWYKKDGLFFADLKDSYGSRNLVLELGGLKTARELREFVMSYAQEHEL